MKLTDWNDEKALRIRNQEAVGGRWWRRDLCSETSLIGDTALVPLVCQALGPSVQEGELRSGDVSFRMSDLEPQRGSPESWPWAFSMEANNFLQLFSLVVCAYGVSSVQLQNVDSCLPRHLVLSLHGKPSITWKKKKRKQQEDSDDDDVLNGSKVSMQGETRK